MTVLDQRDVYCLKCGRRATWRLPTMDTAHPLVTCSHVGSDYRDVGCGRQLGTVDPDEAAATSALLRANRKTAQHERHVLERRNVPDCSLCTGANFLPDSHHHPFERITNKHCLARHLDTHHGQGSGSTMVVTRSITDLTTTHQSLHTGQRDTVVHR